jgi:hypothetical protein
VHWKSTLDDVSLLSEAGTLSLEHSHAPRNRLGDILTEAARQRTTIAQEKEAISALSAGSGG